MPILNVEGYGRVQFPDSMSEQDIAAAIEKQGASGSTIAEHLAADRTFKPTEEQFKRYEEHLKSDETDTPWTQLLIDGAGHMLSTAGSAVAGVVTNPLAAPGSIVEGAAQGTQNLYGMAAQSENPDSWAFRLKDTLFNEGTLNERYHQFLEARDFNTKVEKNNSGEETLLVPKELVDNRIVQGAALILDPSVVLPGIGEALGVGRLASRAVAGATIGVGRAARAVAAPVNSALRIAGEGISKATGLSAHEIQIAAGAAGAGALANPIGQGVVGTVAAARGADIVGDAMTRVGRVMGEQPTRIAPFEMVANDITAPKRVQQFASVAHRLGGDVALDIAPGALAGAVEGATVGGALGYYNNGNEGLASGIGGGLALGSAAGGGVRAVQHLTGHVAVERGRAGGKALVDSLPESEVIGMDTVNTIDAGGNKVSTQVARTTDSKTLGKTLVDKFDAEVKGGAGMVADFFTRASEDGTKVVLIDNTTKLPDSFGVSRPDAMKGVAVTREVDGVTHIILNVDNATKDTAGHELFHTLLGEMSKGEMKRIGSSKLFGIPGISEGLTSPKDLLAWTENHVKSMDKLGSGTWEKARDTVFQTDKSTGEVSIRTDVPPADLLAAQHMIADEMLAEYGGYDIFGKTLLGRDKYSGALRRNKINTVFESIAALARDTWMRTTEGQVARDGIFNTETKSLLNSKGELNRSRELSKFMREVVTRDNSVSEDAVRTRIDFKDTKDLDAINQQLGASSMFELDNNGKVSRVITPDEDKARSARQHADIKAALDAIAVHERGVRRSLDVNGDEVFHLETATPAELAAILKHLNPIQRDNVNRILGGIAGKDGQPIFDVTNFAALATGRNGRKAYRGLAPSERKAILYSLEISKEGNLYTRVLDYDQVSRNMAKALRVPEYSKLWANPSDIIVDLKRYLEHLTKSDKPDSAAMFGVDGEAKRSFFYEVLGVQPAPTKGAYPERPYRAGFTHNSKDSPFRSFRIDRISRIEATGEKAFFNEAQTHHNAQRNYQPADEPGFLPDKSLTDPSRFKAEKLGDTEVHTHESGARVLVKGNVNRVYAADGALLGVTSNDAKAEKLLAKHLEKTTPRYSPLSDADMPAMVDSLPEIDLRELVGKKIAPILADRTMVGTYRGIDSSRVEPVRMTGGVRFPEIKANHEKRVVWASNKDIRNTEVADYHIVGFMEENSHRSNASTIGAMVNTIEAYARDGRISKNGVKLADVEVRRITGDRSAPSVASKEFEAYADKHNMSFEMRKNIADTLTKAKFEKLGFPSMERVLRHTIEPSHTGYNWGDMFLLVKVDKGSPRVPLGVNGVPSHESYKHGQSGTLVGKMSKALSHDILFSEFFDKRRAAGAGTAQDVRSFYLAEPVTTVTAEKVAASGSKTKYTAIRNPKHAAMVVDAALGEWRTSDTAVKDGGVGVVDFVRAIQQSDHAASLGNLTLERARKMVSGGELKIYQLGDAQVFFAIKNMKGGGKELVSVVSNELAVKGVAAPAVMIKAIEEGVTNLDCFAIKSAKHPAGFLPELYSLFGFARVGNEITFSEAHYLAGDYAKRSQHELRDLKHSWESTGWKPEHGDPTVVSMQLELSNDNRRNYRRDYIQPAERALADGLESTKVGADASLQPHSGHSREGGAGSNDARPHSGTEGNLRGSGLDRPNPRVGFNRVIDEVLSLDAGDIRNLKLDQKKVEALRKFRDSTARYSPLNERVIGKNSEHATPPSDSDARAALNTGQRPSFGAARQLESGVRVGLRIDIPAFNRTGNYVVSIHEDGTASKVGAILGYDTVAKVTNPVFSVKSGVERIRDGTSKKFPVATVEGDFKKGRSIPDDIDSWTATGFDPKVHDYFYEKSTDRKVIGGKEAISVGNSVFIKDPVFGDEKTARYSPVVNDAVKSAERQKSVENNEAMRDRVRSRRITSPSAAAAMVGEYPSYLDIPTSYLAEMSEKLKAGKITPREVAKAYAMTITSQGVDSIAVDVIKKEFPQFNPSEMFTGIDGKGKPNIRPEEATAYWFSTPEGKRALDNVESGNFNPEDWRIMQRIRELGGDDRVRNLGMLLREGQRDTWQLTEKAKSKATIYNEDGTPKLALDENGLVKTKTVMHNDGDFTMAFIDEATQLVNETRGDAEQLKDVLERFKGIKAAKSPFMGHLLGFGGDITLDAVEMNYWLSGGGDIKQLGRGVNKSDAKLAAETELKKLVEFVKHDKVAQVELKTRIRAAMRKMRDMTPSAQGIPDSAFYHVMHHWVWDAAKNATTTHEGMYEAMRRYSPFSEATTETLGDVTVTTDKSGMKMTQRGSGGVRLYAPDGKLVGVFGGVAEAIRKASRVAAAKELRRD